MSPEGGTVIAAWRTRRNLVVVKTKNGNKKEKSTRKRKKCLRKISVDANAAQTLSKPDPDLYMNPKVWGNITSVRRKGKEKKSRLTSLLWLGCCRKVFFADPTFACALQVE